MVLTFRKIVDYIVTPLGHQESDREPLGEPKGEGRKVNR